MGLQPWELLGVVCAVTGVMALVSRLVLRWWAQRQLTGLARESAALERWWAIIAELPDCTLDAEVRTTVGQVMLRRLRCAQRIRPDHPSLQIQRSQIAGFTERAQAERTAQTQEARHRTIAALDRLSELLRGAAADRLLSRQALAKADAAISRQRSELEFVQNQRANVQADYLRRVTDALAPGSPRLTQLGASSNALPTQ